ncbi:hypothetical protein RHSIM_Rhsim04G0033000 [Rhododendron simsii]|uniref:Sugar phosphate transporter domain-containing protein n=1 Tax=Rhododendron simsii TaxID=118357 RepID=A0A834LNQ1_RHOSS|nr:hypothetical protein RHSIM_Rhsim04G0033000 [Rhododendron simsii]
MADRTRNYLVREEFLTYAYILLYIALSSGQIFFNKSDCKSPFHCLSCFMHLTSLFCFLILMQWVLSSKEINFPYPLGLTLLHMVFSSVLCFVLTKVLKIMKVEEGMTAEIYATSVIPIGAMFAMTLWLGNTAYLYISVSFAQMLKAIMPVAVFILGVAAGLEVMSCRMLLIMSLISFGVLVASYGEININWIGVVYQMGGVVGEALRLIFMEILVKRKGIKLNPISVMYYVSPCRHVLSSTIESRILSTIFNYFMIDKSCLVNGIIGRNCLLFYAAIAGVAAYNNHKLKKEATRGTSNESQQAESVPLTSSPTTEK